MYIFAKPGHAKAVWIEWLDYHTWAFVMTMLCIGHETMLMKSFPTPHKLHLISAPSDS